MAANQDDIIRMVLLVTGMSHQVIPEQARTGSSAKLSLLAHAGHVKAGGTAVQSQVTRLGSRPQQVIIVVCGLVRAQAGVGV